MFLCLGDRFPEGVMRNQANRSRRSDHGDLGKAFQALPQPLREGTPPVTKWQEAGAVQEVGPETWWLCRQCLAGVWERHTIMTQTDCFLKDIPRQTALFPSRGRWALTYGMC